MNKPSTVQEYVDSTSCPMASGLYVDPDTVVYLQMQLDAMRKLWPTVEPFADHLLSPDIRREWEHFKEEYADLLALTVAFSAGAQPGDYLCTGWNSALPSEVVDAYDDFLYRMACFNGILDYLGQRM